MSAKRNTEFDFWKRVYKTDTCWLWTGARVRYGRFCINCKTSDTHRLAWEFVNGMIPHGMCVLHKCDNVLCVNPSHLFLGTHADNMADKVSKNRQANGERLAKLHRGELGSRSVLRICDVERIKEASLFGASRRNLAAIYGVHYTTISDVCRGDSWNNIGAA